MIGDLPTFLKKISSSEWQVEEQLRLFQFIKTNGFPSCSKDWLDLGKVLQNKSPNRIRAIVQKLLEVESSTPSDNASIIATITPQELLLIIGELNRIVDESLSNCVIAHVRFFKNYSSHFKLILSILSLDPWVLCQKQCFPQTGGQQWRSGLQENWGMHVHLFLWKASPWHEL